MLIAMPFTPFHLGPSLWIGLLLFTFLDVPSLLVASVIVDVEPFTVMILGLRYPLHGFFHSFIGGAIAAMLTALTMYAVQPMVRKVTTLLRLEQDSSFTRIVGSSFLGVYGHIVLDAFLYADIQPFYPNTRNPFLGLVSSRHVYGFCSISFPIALGVYILRVWTTRRRP